MQTMISIVLLLKSLFKRELSFLDIQIACGLRAWWLMEKADPVPAWLEMITNLTAPAILPEAWADYIYEWKTDLFPGNEHQDWRGGE
jgi:hypothetical protein